MKSNNPSISGSCRVEALGQPN